MLAFYIPAVVKSLFNYFAHLKIIKKKIVDCRSSLGIWICVFCHMLEIFFPNLGLNCFFACAFKDSACHAGDPSSISGLGRSPAEGKGYLLLYSLLENSVDCIVNGVAKNWQPLRDFHFHFLIINSFKF